MAAPECHYDDLAVYTSVQTQFPAVYESGMMDYLHGASTKRKGQGAKAAQKAYLMALRPVGGEYFAQLAFHTRLFSVKSRRRTT